MIFVISESKLLCVSISLCPNDACFLCLAVCVLICALCPPTVVTQELTASIRLGKIPFCILGYSEDHKLKEELFVTLSKSVQADIVPPRECDVMYDVMSLVHTLQEEPNI